MRLSILAAVAALIALPAIAHDGPHIHDPYARVSPAGSGAVFLVIENHSANDDRLVSATSDVADRVELHTHITDANGVMQMVEVEEGFEVKGESTRALERGGDHIMLLGLTRPLKDGDTFDLTLTFERGEVITVTVPVDNARKPSDGMDHSGHGMDDGAMNHSGHGTDAAATGHAAHGHGAPAAVDTTGMSDPEAITAIMKAQFDTPENPLTVEPVVVEGDHALASWFQGDKGGRALLERRHGQWVIVLCGGADLRMPEFLASRGVSAADRLSQLYNAQEDALGADKVSLASTFEGIVEITP